MPCANCRADLSISEDMDSESEQFSFMFAKNKAEESKRIPISEAIRTVFEGTLKLNKNQVSSSARIKMCPECLRSLADLHRSYNQFMELTKELSYIQQLLNTSILWTFEGLSGERSEYCSPFLEVKMELEEENPTPDEVQIKEELEDPDFLCKYSQEDDQYDSGGEMSFPFFRSTRRTTAEKFGRSLLKKRVAARGSKLVRKTANRVAGGKRKTHIGGLTKLPISIVCTTKPSTTRGPGEEKPYKCSADGCTKSFKDGKLYRRHIKFKHGGATSEELGEVTCNLCPKPKVFGIPSQLKDHVDAVHATDMLFHCSKCERKFPTQNRLNIHCLMKHSDRILPKEKEPILCPHKCSEETFKSKVSLKLHLKSVHNEKVSYPCSSCGKKFHAETRYRRHLKYKHGEGLTEQDLEGRTCGVCARVFETPSQLRYHTDSVHATEKPFECDLCGNKFPTKTYLSIHRHMKHPEKPIRHPCDTCGKTFCNKPALQDHIHAVHLRKKDIVCDVCGKKFARESGLKQHMEVHDPTREKSLQCPICSQLFISEYTLKCHAKVHSGVKDQLCPHCGDAFLHLNSLRRHLHAKHGVVTSTRTDSNLEHRCEQCGKTFKLKEYLQQHLRSVTHGGKGHTGQRRRSLKAEKDPNSAPAPRKTAIKPSIVQPPKTNPALPAGIDFSTIHSHSNLFWGHGSMIPGHPHYY